MPPKLSGRGKENKKVALVDQDPLAMTIEDGNVEYDDLDSFYETIKNQCVLSERWSMHSPMQDVTLNNMKVMMIMEVDVTVEGDMRVKRCVKIQENRSFRVFIDNVDMTHLFETDKKIITTMDMDKLLYNVVIKKVCQGLRTYDPAEPSYSKANFPVRQRGKLWYAKDCTIVVNKSFMGNSCAGCQRIRNQMKRRFQNDRRKAIVRPLKQVKSSFGKALYSTLNDFSGKGPIPPSQYPRTNMVFDEKLEVHINRQLQQRLALAASMPPPPAPIKRGGGGGRKSRKSSSKGGQQQQFGNQYTTITTAGRQAIPVQEFITEDGQVCYLTSVMDPNDVAQFGQISGIEGGLQWGQMMIEKYEPPDNEELVSINDRGNIIIQNIQGEEFTLAEGQEYELIGEAQPHIDPIEVLPADNQQIQIIEVDDETMEQIEVHGSMDNMQIAAVDPNDPNLSQLLRAFQMQGMTM